MMKKLIPFEFNRIIRYGISMEDIADTDDMKGLDDEPQSTEPEQGKSPGDSDNVSTEPADTGDGSATTDNPSADPESTDTNTELSGGEQDDPNAEADATGDESTTEDKTPEEQAKLNNAEELLGIRDSAEDRRLEVTTSDLRVAARELEKRKTRRQRIMDFNENNS